MSEVPFGRTVRLVTTRSTTRGDFRIGLEAVEKATGRLSFDPDVQYEGDGISFHRGDVLFGKLRPNLRKAWLADTDGDAVGDFHVYRPVPSVMTSQYLAYVVLSEPFLEPVIASVYGARMPRADWGEIRNIKVWVPDPPEQRAIAEYLDRETAQIDAFIAKNEELLALIIERRASSIVEQIGKFETIPLKRLVLPERPLTYGILQVGEPVEQGVPYLLPADFVGESAAPELSSLLKTTPETAAPYARAVVRSGDIVITIGPGYGRVSLVTAELDGVFLTRDTVRIAPVSSKARAEYLMWVLRSRVASDFWDRTILGSTFRRLNVGTLGDTPIPLPPLSEQLRIVERIDDIVVRSDVAITTARRAISLARERRAALISAAVTGKIEVGVAA